jgi:hypothetical protein
MSLWRIRVSVCLRTRCLGIYVISGWRCMQALTYGSLMYPWTYACMKVRMNACIHKGMYVPVHL